MSFRIATLNLAQNYKNSQRRRRLVVQQLAELNPDLLALNEIHVPEQPGRWLKSEGRRTTRSAIPAGVEGRVHDEGLLTRYPPIETANLDYNSSHDCVAMAARFGVGARLIDGAEGDRVLRRVVGRQHVVTALKPD